MEIQSKCSVFAAMNHRLNAIPRNSKSETQDQELKLLNMEASMASRFDLIFMLEKPCENYDDIIAGYILDKIVGCNQKKIAEEQAAACANWSLERLKLHVLCARGLDVEITHEVFQVINKYFAFCQACEGINKSRTTIRQMISLQRLTISHAKLLLRKKTKLIDVLTAVWLMENSWTFGDLIEPVNFVISELPIGPSIDCNLHVLKTLRLSHLIDVYQMEEEITSNESLRPMKSADMLFEKDECEQIPGTSIYADQDQEIPANLQKSFAISCIDDLFDKSDNDDDDIDTEMMEAALGCSLTNAVTETIEPKRNNLDEIPMSSYASFKIPAHQSSTQVNIANSSMVEPKEAEKPANLHSLFSKRSKTSIESKNDVKKLKISAAADKVFDLFNKSVSKIDSSASTSVKKTPSFTDRLKVFEYVSQEPKDFEMKSDEKPMLKMKLPDKEKQKEEPKTVTEKDESEFLLQNLQNLSNVLKQNGESSKKFGKKKIQSTQSKEEYFKKIEAELGSIWK